MQHDHLGAIVADSPGLTAIAAGPLEGIDAVVKDCFAVSGHTSSFGLGRWRDTHSPAVAHSAVVAELLGAGADILGLTVLDQLAFSLVGDVNEGDPPVNPRHPELRCGGSSSGSAAAVAGGIASLGVGTDTAGSVRVPAAVCGIHGLRPTWGSIDMSGCLPLAPSLDTVGLLAANPAVLSRSLAVLGSHNPSGSGDAGPAPLRRVLVDPSMGTPEGSALMDAASCVARVVGAEVETVRAAYLFSDDVADLFSRIQGREVWETLGSWVAANDEALDPDVAWRLGMCRRYANENAATVAVDNEDRRLLTEILGGIVQPGCVLVTPVLGGPGPRVDDPPEQLARFRRRSLALAAPAALAGWPQLTWSRFGDAPVHDAAVGLLARPGNDGALVDLLGDTWRDDVRLDDSGDEQFGDL